MMRYAIFGLLLFAGFGVAVAPAGLLKRALESNSNATLLQVQGTLWNGQGQLLLNNIPAGNITWNFNKLALLKAKLSYVWSLQNTDWQLSGEVGRSWSMLEASLVGQVDTDAANQYLRRYDITLEGDLVIAPSQFMATPDFETITHLDGQIQWSGGTINYTLSGLTREANLPPLEAFLSIAETGEPQAVVFAKGQQTPLLITTLRKNGFVKVGITKLFTKMLGNPWPGSDPDHAIVVEVEEQVL